MKLFSELFSSPFGIFSAIVIIAILVMAVFFIYLFVSKSAQKPGEK
ncbi:DUF3149 domain-containing protein [Kangiella sediminilitoris]|uniref:DUF3149 domain-containing protein n=1 Tax=Kangiella sediminilitoris TaxID=1144748 RepID=A0A1B3BDA6_9GAMM|nr:DUF3149 domain-containing protein [Kangiella sediminilitoris]AOE50667.1 hypothetical protein KS2013_1958 [Kangiella sediminilitoris]